MNSELRVLSSYNGNRGRLGYKLVRRMSEIYGRELSRAVFPYVARAFRYIGTPGKGNHHAILYVMLPGLHGVSDSQLLSYAETGNVFNRMDALPRDLIPSGTSPTLFVGLRCDQQANREGMMFERLSFPRNSGVFNREDFEVLHRVFDLLMDDVDDKINLAATVPRVLAEVQQEARQEAAA